MKLATFERKGDRRLGAVVGKRVVDLAEAVGHPVFPATMETLVASDRGTVLEAAREALTREDVLTFAVPAARLQAPLLPSSIRDFGTGRTYRTVNHRSAVGPGAAIEPPPFVRELDVELKLACVVSRWGRELTVAEASRSILGYTLALAWVARDEERREMAAGGAPARARDFATSLGPVVETVEDLPDPSSLTLSLTIDGVVRTEGDLSGLGWSFPEMLAYLSKAQDLWPGDVVMAGAVADPCDQGRAPCLDRGAVVEGHAEGFGTLGGTVAATRPPKRFG
ncbi:MAG TPA: fumarylacetoacetate hydrolase family protein [Actinomycetota bacterium]